MSYGDFDMILTFYYRMIICRVKRKVIFKISSNSASQKSRQLILRFLTKANNEAHYLVSVNGDFCVRGNHFGGRKNDFTGIYIFIA